MPDAFAGKKTAYQQLTKSRSLVPVFVMVALVLVPGIVIAQNPTGNDATAEELERQIENQNERINEIEQEIDEYENELTDTRKQKDTLQNTLDSLNNSINQLQLRVEKTTRQINNTQNRIKRLDQNLASSERRLSTTKQSLAQSLRLMYRTNSQSIITSLLANETLSEVWKTSDQLSQIQAGIQNRMKRIQQLKETQENQREQAQERSKELTNLESKLARQQDSLRSQRQQKQQLLAETNHQEDEYQNLLAEKQQQKEEFEKQLQSYESQLESTVSDDEVPGTGNASFQWPVPEVTITQRFGGTDFAERNPSAYGRPFHNGTDFGAAVGTPIKPTKRGIVRAFGNTDTISGCYSYGKWILVDHDNLSTLYAHLSSINVSEGQSVNSDTIIGRVGNTGYSTGPHLHLTTYIKNDVNITELGQVKEQTNCGRAAIPVAPQAGYLNPMKYLP
jgi:murein DD-endopeptidase MepM/ murein hydrolase activator NlpD